MQLCDAKSTVANTHFGNVKLFIKAISMLRMIKNLLDVSSISFLPAAEYLLLNHRSGQSRAFCRSNESLNVRLGPIERLVDGFTMMLQYSSLS